MNLNFTLSPIPKTFCGPGAVRSVSGLLKPFGHNVLVLAGKHVFQTPAWNLFTQFPHAAISGEPSPQLLDALAAEYRSKSMQVVVAIGGGSVIDTGKALSSMLLVEGSIADYLETIGTKSHPGTKLPFIAVPTTAGTGSEATKNAVISSIGPQGYKKSLRHDAFMPDYAIIDPELSCSCPYDLTIWCGMDALSQLLESFVSTKATLFSETCSLAGLEYFGKYFDAVLVNGNDLEARTGMAYAAYLSGLALCFGGLGAVHGLAGAIGGMCAAPHGYACAALMYETNARTIKRLIDEKAPALTRFARASEALLRTKFDSPLIASEALLEKISVWHGSANLKGLSYFGFTREMADKIAQNPDCKNNPIPLTHNDITSILYAAAG